LGGVEVWEKIAVTSPGGGACEREMGRRVALQCSKVQNGMGSNETDIHRERPGRKKKAQL
jgi:hypothetical protein